MKLERASVAPGSTAAHSVPVASPTHLVVKYTGLEGAESHVSPQVLCRRGAEQGRAGLDQPTNQQHIVHVMPALNRATDVHDARMDKLGVKFVGHCRSGP